MIDARLALAVEGGAWDLPATGRIAVLHPPGAAQLAMLPKDRVHVVEGFKPDHDRWIARGFDCGVEMGSEYAASIVSVPRAKAEARALIADAVARTRGPVVIDGQKTDGIDSLLKELRKRARMSGVISKAHGKLSVMTADVVDFEDWQQGPALTPGGFWTAPGVFSADGIDPASALLAENLPARLGRTVADLGAGWGFLSAHILERADVEALHLVEAERIALECARRNVGDPRAAFHWADATVWQAPARLEAVVMNPPFHTSRAADPALGQAFVKAAASQLAPHGQLWMVANRHLPYEKSLRQFFSNVFEIGGDARFKLFHATRPKRS